MHRLPVVRAWRAQALGLAALLWSLPAAGAIEIRFATIAPKASTWGKVLDIWERAVEQRTGGEIDLSVYYNAVQGDDAGMVAKMKSGQLDGAALSGVGLSLIHRDVLVLQLPGVTNSWPLADLVRSLMIDDIRPGFQAAGFELMEWGDIGLVYQMSYGSPVKNPKDLRGRRPLVWRNEPIGPLIYSFIGQVVPVPLGPTEILPALRARSIDVVAAPALAAEQMQWTPYVDHLNDNVIVAAIGATVLRSQKLASLPPELRKTLEELQARSAALHTQRVRQLDGEAIQRMKRRMTVVAPSDDDRVDWYRVFLKAVRRMRHGIFPKDLLDRVLHITGKG
jgi:TRAP-type transport system periplasmic protein